VTEQSPTLAEQLREMATWADAQAPVFDKVDGTKMRAAADRLEALEEVARLAAPVVAFALPNRGMGHPDVVRLRDALAALTQEDR
jgi:hypothetical protein